MVYTLVALESKPNSGINTSVHSNLKPLLIEQNPCSNKAVHMLLDLFVCFVALGPKSTAMVMAGRSVHLTTLFPGQA